MFSSPIASYRKMDLESDVFGADSHRLIVLLFDGAEAALAKAQLGLANRDVVLKSESLLKAIDIINDGLAASLNLEAGGDLAANLYALYSYMVNRLIYANTHQDANAVSEVQKLLGEISSAWREIGSSVKRDAQQPPMLER